MQAIVAHGLNMEIGAGNKLLWQLPEDLAHFKRETLRAPALIMGRKTWESLPFPVLPGREMHVVSTQSVSDLGTHAELPGVVIHSSIESAIKSVDADKATVVGGGQIYKAALCYLDRILVTRVMETFPLADAFMPNYEQSGRFLLVCAGATKQEGDIKYRMEEWASR